MIIKRLSHRKIQVERNIEIYCGSSKIGEVNINCRYKYGFEFLYPQLLPIHDRFYNQLSNKYGLKKKHISLRTKNINVAFEGKNIILRQCPDFIDFGNVEWFIAYNRNKILNNILT